MIAPLPFKYKCPTCSYSKVIKPKSDVLDSAILNNICPKCGTAMETKSLGSIERIIQKFLH